MPSEVRMPRMSQTTDEVRLLRWLVREGDRVERGDPLCQVETDKTTMDVEAFRGGTVLKLCVPDETVVNAGEPIAYLGEQGEEVPAAALPAQQGAPDEKKPGTVPEKATAGAGRGAPAGEKPQEGRGAAGTAGRRTVISGGKSLRATPLVQNLARKRGIPLEEVTGSGPGGLITRKDLESYSPLTGGARKGEGVFSEHQSAVARSVTRSKQEVPHFYLKCGCFCDNLLRLRKKSQESDGWKPTVDSIFIYAVSRVLLDNPRINSSFIEGGPVFHSGVHVGFAVAAADELYAPVIRDAHKKDLREIDGEVRRLAEKARRGALEPGDTSGATFTVTNLGMYPVDEFCAIINPPQSGILAIGRIAKTLCIDESEGMRIRSACTLTGSFDHRIVYGAAGAAFLEKIRSIIERGVLEP
jgi:pyruvate dehydrogenase E2 component (dihydrolipoamide acetyltransferase)